jgi:hypothetical protein
MKSRMFLIGALTLAATLAIVAFVRPSDYPTGAGRNIEYQRKNLPGTTLSISIPVGWDDFDHSSCKQPCARLKLSEGPDGRQYEWPRITFERLGTAALLPPDRYVEGYLGALPLWISRDGPRRQLLGTHSVLEFTVAGDMISHGPEDYARGTATRTPMESLHLVFAADRHTYHCELETYAGGLARSSDAFRFFCASVGRSSR